jgi:hypothetical protein
MNFSIIICNVLAINTLKIWLSDFKSDFNFTKNLTNLNNIMYLKMRLIILPFNKPLIVFLIITFIITTASFVQYSFSIVTTHTYERFVLLPKGIYESCVKAAITSTEKDFCKVFLP